MVLQPSYLREQVLEAQGMPSKENIVKRLNFCMWTEQAVRWLPMDKWDACSSSFTAADLEGKACFAGLDLASIHDLAALLLLFPLHVGYKVLPFFWIPKESSRSRAERRGR